VPAWTASTAHKKSPIARTCERTTGEVWEETSSRLTLRRAPPVCKRDGVVSALRMARADDSGNATGAACGASDYRNVVVAPVDFCAAATTVSDQPEAWLMAHGSGSGRLDDRRLGFGGISNPGPELRDGCHQAASDWRWPSMKAQARSMVDSLTSTPDLSLVTKLPSCTASLPNLVGTIFLSARKTSISDRRTARGFISPDVSRMYPIGQSERYDVS
jgi:hypothetical protein